MGVQLKLLNLFGPIREMVHIEQKTVKHSPSDKLYDAFISVLAGAGGLVEINNRLQSRPGFAESVRTQPLCRAVGGASNAGCLYGREVKQMEQAVDVIYRQLQSRLST